MRYRFAIFAIGYSATALGQVPGRLGYQGRLLKSDGSPETGVVSMSFAVYDVATGGTPLGCDMNQVAVSDGYYSVVLGGVGGCAFNPPAIAAAIFDGKDLWLEVWVGGTPLSPRQRIGSVAYALRAATAVNIRGGTVEATTVTVGGPSGVTISGTGIAVGTTTVVDASGSKATVSTGAGLTGNGSTAMPLAVAADGVTNALLASDAASLAKVSGGAMSAAGASVGIGTTTPDNALTVRGNGRISVDHATEPSVFYRLGGVDTAYVGLGPGVITGLGASEMGIRGNAGISLGARNARDVVLTPTGEVGIGTTNPAAKLEVAGGWIYASNGAGLGLPVNTGSLNIIGGPGGSGGYVVFSGTNRSAGSEFGSVIIGSNQGTNAGQGIRLETTGQVERLRITENGNVGIGTSAPGARLHVNGDVIVEGMVAERGKVYVVATSSADWASCAAGHQYMPAFDIVKAGNSGGWFSGAGNNRFTAPVTGLYLFAIHHYGHPPSGTAGYWHLGWSCNTEGPDGWCNNKIVRGNWHTLQRYPSLTGNGVSESSPMFVHLSAGETIRPKIYCSAALTEFILGGWSQYTAILMVKT